ncbi:MAG: hypothetical protein RQ756_02850, partial [Flavobacteriaceae bacterium]|nr:hypothetical protein [Flavobacteriaceae bacterium]
VEVDPELIFVNISDFSDASASISNAAIQVNIKQVCPIPPGNFLGDYQMAQITPIHPDNGVLSFNDQVVNVQQATSGVNDRIISLVWLEALGIGQPASNIPFGLVCNEVVINSNAISTNLTCGDGTITLGRPNVNSTYDPDDDSFFELTLAEYVVDGGCGVPAPLQTTFGFTKI